ncbi:MAG: septum formation initiator family protein [Ignavibacteria bacterium]|jgi:cell division protein FtsB|nr:septum formation initiator family protein [Ignavibacteria bacterium]
MIDKIKEWINQNRILCFALLFVGASILLLFVDNSIKINALLTEIQQEKSILNDYKANNELLNSKIIELESADRIYTIARGKLGLVMPTKVPIVIDGDTKPEVQEADSH